MGDRTADRAWIEQNVCSVSQCKGDWISVDDLVLINLLLHGLFIFFLFLDAGDGNSTPTPFPRSKLHIHDKPCRWMLLF